MHTEMQLTMGYELNLDIVRHIQNLSLTHVDKNNNSYLTQRINNDSNELIAFCITTLQNIIINFVLLIVLFVILSTINLIISGLLFIFLLIFLVLHFMCKKPIRKTNLTYKENQNKFFSTLYGQLFYLKLVKVNAIQAEINSRLGKSFKNLKESALKYQKINHLFSGLDGFISTIAQIVLFIAGGIQILNGNLSIGMFTIFSSYFNMIIGASRYFLQLGASYQSRLVSYERLSEILNIPQETYGTQLIEDIHTISFENVSFAYGTKTVLQDYILAFKKGNIYAIVGSNGAGKSTLIHLMLGFYVDEKEGNVKYNNVDIKSVDMLSLRKNKIGFSEQQVVLINDTIALQRSVAFAISFSLIYRRFHLRNQGIKLRNQHLFTWFYRNFVVVIGYNLTFNHSLKYDQIEKYLSTLNMTDYINNLDGGIKFTLNEKNNNLSGGEKQKISILKVLLKNPQVMIFDEPTSELDTVTVNAIIKRQELDKLACHQINLYNDIIQVYSTANG